MFTCVCFAGEEASLSVKDVLSLGLGLCIQTQPLSPVPAYTERTARFWGCSL